ncbi:hypothetical protein FLM48_16495 [Shewanella sp. Scap07]|uniref:hypothetical protein n=1 Tax=Shewanella sp. Scap07 TaxID=2589987 RepID=UPI0015B79A4B|nr:hypothetical protein [Shewanella sp. Scap07]QLE86522.1 hypothetical protein FLM48_16495 [Shewanella sp. Scap07]
MSSVRRRKKKQADQKGWLLLAVCVCILTVAGYFLYEANANVIKRETVSSCRLDGYVSRETAIVIDATDSFSETQAMLVTKEIQKTLSEALIDEKFTLYVLNESVGKNSSIVEGCNAGDGSEANELTSNKRRLKKQWNENFYNRFVVAVENLVGQHSAKESPIFEMIKFVSVNTMYDSKAENKRIILVSDMLHHTSKYSQYRQNTSFNSFEASSYSLEVRPHLRSVDVEILYVVRAKDRKLQNRGHIGFWEAFVSNAGGQVITVKSIN